MKKKIVWACLAGLLSGSVFGLGSLNVNFANHVNSCDISYYGAGSYPWSLTNYTESGTVSEQVSFENYIILSNITVNLGYLPVVSVIDEYLYDDVVTNKLSGSSGNYSYKPRYDTGWITFDLQTILITNTITYVTNGGVLPGSTPTIYTIESPDVTLPTPSYAHYSFGGWYDNSDLTGARITTIPTGSVGNRTFYAKWTPEVYSVTLNFDGGWISVNGEQVSASPFVTNYIYGVGLTLPTFGRTGYQVGGWHLLQDCSDQAVTSIGTTDFDNKEFWAKLTEQPYTVALDNQGADVSGTSSVSVSYNGDFPTPINCPKKAGYEFKGYFAQVDGQGTQYYKADGTAYGNVWPTAADGTIYAHWIPHTYTLSFDAGEGVGEMAPMALTYGVETNLPANAFSKIGYQFAGWTTNETYSVTFADGQTVSNLTTEADATVTMTATWSPGHYFIAFDANATDAEGEMAVQDIEYDRETALGANTFTRVGYSLAGWAWNKGATTNEIDFADCQIVTNLTDEIGSTNTLYAVWAAESYEVTLNADAERGGYFREVTNVVVTVTTNIEGTVTNVVQEVATNVVKVATDQVRVTYGAPYDLPVPTNEGKWMTFVKWRHVDPATGDLKPLPSTVPLHAEGVTNLVAQWTDSLAVALNAEGTDLEYKSGGIVDTRTTEYSWLGQELEADGYVGQSGDLPDVDHAISYLQTVLPGAGVLTYRWRISAPVGFYRKARDSFYGNRILFVDAGSDASTPPELVPYLATGDDLNSTEWKDSGWQHVAFTNNSENPLTVEWRFEAQLGQDQSVGGTGWVDNVTWTPADGSRPVATVTPYDEAYDGAGHGITVNVTTPTSGAAVKYALAQEGPYSTESILFTNATDTAVTVWYTVEAENYVTITNSGTVKISPKDLTETMVSLAETSYIYDGSAKEPTVTVADGEPSILAATDYDVTYSNNVEVGEATVVVTGKGNYAGEVQKHFTIASAEPPSPAEIVHAVSSYEGVYDGEGHGITVSVTTPESGWIVKYASDEAGPYAVEPILFTDVTETAVTVWYTVEAENYATVTNSGTVKILPKVVPEDLECKIPWPTDKDGAYNPLVANVYDGWVMGADGFLAGIVQVKADKNTKEKTVTTNVAVTATVKDVAGKSWSYSKGVGTVEGVVTGLVCTTKGVAVASFGVELGANGLSGKWSSLAVVGARNGMGTNGDAMMAALEAYKGSWSVAFTNEMGVTRLQLVIGAKGSTKITGTTADGFKVSATVQGVMGEDAFFVPYLATLKSGKLTTEANLLLCIGKDGAVAALASNLGPLVAGGRTTDAIEFMPYVESVSSKGGEAYAGAVVLNDLAYPAKFAAKGLPAGLKIDAATGVITGTPTKPGHYVATITVTSGINSKAKVETTVAFDIANYTDDQIPVKDEYGPYHVGVKVYEPIDDALGCTVSGLPAGLKYAAKETKDATFGVVPAGTVYGVPTKAGESTAYFKKSTKETNDVGKVVTVNHQASATFRVAALPAWAQGTFDGNVKLRVENGELGDGATGTTDVSSVVDTPSGLVSLTISAAGKISGKLLEGGKTWTLSAVAYDEVERRMTNGESLDDADDEFVFFATVIGKSGKEIMTNVVEVAAGLLRYEAVDGFDVRGVANGQADGAGLPEQMAWTVWQNLWKTEPWKSNAKSFANKTLVLSGVADGLPSEGDTVTLKFASSGAVTASGKFTGKDGKTYSASCSSVLIPESEVHYAVYLHFPPKDGKFDGHSVKVPLFWNGTTFE